MTKDRCMDLLNQVIDHVSAGQNTNGQIHELLLIGFTPEELIQEFNFDKQDVDDVLSESEE